MFQKVYVKAYLYLMTLLIACCASVQADSEAILITRVVSVYDGDTFKVDIDQWPDIVGNDISVRVARIDTPEIRGSCPKEKELAIKAREFVKSKLESAKEIRLVNIQRDKYFRLLADIDLDGKDLSQELIIQGLAVEYDGGSKVSWCP